MNTMKCLIIVLTMAVSSIVCVNDVQAVNVIYVNGIQNTLPEAQASRKRLKEVLDASTNHTGDRKKTYSVSGIWNPIGWYGSEDDSKKQDIMELFLLKTAEEKYAADFEKIVVPFNQCKTVDKEAAGKVNAYLEDMTPGDNSLETDGNIDDYNMRNTKNAAQAIARTVKSLGSAIVVAHSQGNLLANLAYAKLGSDGEDTKNMIRIVNVANTAMYSVNNLNLTHSDDRALWALKKLLSAINWTRTTPMCPDNGVCDFTLAAPTFGPIADIRDADIFFHSLEQTYLSTAVIHEVLDQGISFTPNAERFIDRFEDILYNAAESLADDCELKSLKFILNSDLTGISTPNDWVAANGNRGNAIFLPTFDGRDGVMLFTGNGARITQDKIPAVPITSDLIFNVTFRIDYANLTGDGWYGVEGPMTLWMSFTKPGSPDISFVRYYNYTHNSGSASNPKFELVPQSTWVTKTYTLSQLGVPIGYNLSSILVGSTGWVSTTYVDKVELVESQVQVH